MAEKLAQGTVIDQTPCHGCNSLQDLKIDKSGKVCQVCGMCATRIFYGKDKSARLVAQYRAKTGATVAPAPIAKEPAKDASQRASDEPLWYQEHLYD